MITFYDFYLFFIDIYAILSIFIHIYKSLSIIIHFMKALIPEAALILRAIYIRHAMWIRGFSVNTSTALHWHCCKAVISDGQMLHE